ncbi:MAG: 2-dehydropantoate 2-reductase [Actinomycetota bacterium]|nr:2-dehydropantoate 2-reductase [Actinomycetota bacterium]MDQ1564170.1 2-dehydropantoate 2-reductase [Actinomycetota bacterium]
MRIGVIGAGAVGGAIAAMLARAGHEVEVTARGEHLRAIEANGIRLTGGWGDFTAHVAAASELNRAPEIAFIATKAQDAERAIRANQRLLTGVPTAVVQNGLGSVSATAPLLPRSDVVGVLALYASSLVAPGEIAITTAGNTYVGGGRDLPARFISSVLNTVMPTSVANNFVGAQWTKLVINQVNALPAITGLSVQEVIANPKLRRIMTLSMRENVRVGLRSGVTFAEVQGLTSGRLKLFSRAPLWLAESLPKLMARRMGATPNPGSTLQSIRRGALTEIDYLNGAVVSAAAEVGVATPVNASLVALVHEVEQTHRFLAPDEVAARAITTVG